MSAPVKYNECASFPWISNQIIIWGSREGKRCLLLGRKSITSLDSILKSRDITLPTKVRIVKTMVFPVVILLDHKEVWALKNWRFQTVVLEKTPQSPLDNSKEIKPGNQLWRTEFIGRIPIHWKDWCWSWRSSTLATICAEPTHWERSWCWERWKAGEAGNRGWDGWMASLTLGDSKEQGSLVCCSTWSRKESDTT